MANRIKNRKHRNMKERISHLWINIKFCCILHFQFLKKIVKKCIYFNLSIINQIYKLYYKNRSLKIN